jgi:hypothetical protein
MVRENDVYNLVSESDSSLHDVWTRGCCFNFGKKITIQTESGYLLPCKIKEEMIVCDKCRDQS